MVKAERQVLSLKLESLHKYENLDGNLINKFALQEAGNPPGLIPDHLEKPMWKH